MKQRNGRHSKPGEYGNHVTPTHALTGTITAAFGRHYEVHTSQGRFQCYPKGKKSTFACGDQVDLHLESEHQGVLTHLHPRHNLLWRSDAFRQKLIAANLTTIVIVVATEPGFSDLLISRCIVAAEHQNIRPVIVLNKADLADRLTPARERLTLFSELGYTIIETCALQGATELHDQLTGEHSLLIGQSGMGKSTLTNILIPHAQAATREISTALDTGKHTTTFARLYPLATPARPEQSGWVIDSPGLQAFGLAHLTAEELAESFIEFRPHLGQCRFRDCHHEQEPGCAIRTACENSMISERRFEHYRTIRAEIAHARQLNPGW